MCFDKAMDMIAALKPTPEAKKYSSSKLQRLRATCSLLVSEMANGLLELYKMLLIEGHSKRGTKSVLANALHPTAENDNPGLIYISPELVGNIRDCKYGLDGTHHTGIAIVAFPRLRSRTCPFGTNKSGK
jgi:regulator of sigma D